MSLSDRIFERPMFTPSISIHASSCDTTFLSSSLLLGLLSLILTFLLQLFSLNVYLSDHLFLYSTPLLFIITLTPHIISSSFRVYFSSHPLITCLLSFSPLLLLKITNRSSLSTLSFSFSYLEPEEEVFFRRQPLPPSEHRPGTDTR